MDVLLFIVDTFSTPNLVSHCNNETTHCILDDALLKYTLSYHGEPKLRTRIEALVSEDTPLRETALVTLRQNNQTIHTSQFESSCL